MGGAPCSRGEVRVISILQRNRCLQSPSRPYSVGNAVNSAGTVVGTGTTTSWGASPLPLIWKSGMVAQLPMPPGEEFGRAYGINASEVAVGSVGAGSWEFGVIYSGGSASYITTMTQTGCFIRTAFGINDSGLVVGFGIDPNDWTRNVAFAWDSVQDKAFEVGILPGTDGGIAFGVSNAGHVTGVSTLGQGGGVPFIWSESTGTVAIPLPEGTGWGEGRGVNTQGWAVGYASSEYSIPFLYDGTATYRLADLLPPGSGWDLSTNVYSSADGISEDGVIVGTGVHNDEIRAYAMIPGPYPLLLDIKPGGCPNPLNRDSHGVLPVAIAGGGIDLASIDLATLRLSRADGVGGSVAPLMDPQGPHPTFEDVTAPHDNAACACIDAKKDHVMDLSIHFNTDELVEALELGEFAPGYWVELKLTGNLVTGQALEGTDCVLLVPPGMPPGLVSVGATVPGTWIDIQPPDLTLDGGGFASFDRVFAQSTLATFVAPEISDNHSFRRWVINGAPQLDGQTIVQLAVIDSTTRVQAEYGPKNLPLKPGKPGSGGSSGTAATTTVSLE